MERERSAVVASQGRDPVQWHLEAAQAYRKAWADSRHYGMYKALLAKAYKACRVEARRLMNA